MTKHSSASCRELAPLRKQSVVSLVIATVVLPTFVIVAILAFPSSDQSSVGAAVAAAVAALIAGALFAATRRRSIVLESDALVLRATVYTRRIALSEIRLADARVIDLREHPEQRPLLRTNGLAVPGLAAGNFRDRKRNRIFCLITAPRVLILPLTDGGRILVSPLRPEALLDELRARASHG